MVTAQRAPVYVAPDDTARVVGSLPVDTHVRAAGSDTAECVRVSSIVPNVRGWVRREDSAELRRRERWSIALLRYDLAMEPTRSSAMAQLIADAGVAASYLR